jgi:hypothetical protein
MSETMPRPEIRHMPCSPQEFGIVEKSLTPFERL